MNTSRALAILMAVGLMLAACGGDPVESAEYQALADDLDSARNDLAALEADLASVSADLSEVEGQLGAATETIEGLEGDVASEQATIAGLEDEKGGLEAQVTALEAERDAALEEVDSLLFQFDDEIRASLQAEFDAEVTRACDDAKINYETPIASIVTYDDRWDPIGSLQDLTDAVSACSADERSKTVEEREAARLAACETINPDQLEKDPSAYEGDCLVMYAYIVQFDAATGPCYFHANVDDRRSTRWYDYDLRAAFGYTDDIDVAAFERSCPALDEIDSDDFVKIWATGLGPLTYDTAAGGTNSIPAFKIEAIEIVQKN